MGRARAVPHLPTRPIPRRAPVTPRRSPPFVESESDRRLGTAATPVAPIGSIISAEGAPTNPVFRLANAT